jgi:hypothetical protein
MTWKFKRAKDAAVQDTGKYQAQQRRDHPGRKARLIKHGNQDPGPPYTSKPSMKRSKSAPVVEALGKIDISSFKLQDSLNPDVWSESQEMSEEIRERLVHIANEFLRETDIDIEIKDIVLTGSLANYNWSSYSDFDLHIIIEYKDLLLEPAMARKFLNTLRSSWNNRRSVYIKGHDVEIYLEDAGEPHISTGIYSVLNGKWLVKPIREEGAIDYEGVTKKSLDKMQEIDNIQSMYDKGDYKRAKTEAKRLKSKIKRMRKSGLDKSGIYSNENLAFKVLRRNGELQRLFGLFDKSKDKILSLDEIDVDAR